MINQLKELVKNTNTRVLSQVIKSQKNIVLYNWILVETNILPNNSSTKERIYYILHGKPELKCKNGNIRKFATVRLEYGFCDNIKNCKCFREKQSADRQGYDMSNVVNKRKETWMEKYGVENVSQSEIVKAKRKGTMSTRNYEKLHQRLAYDKETLGYDQVINRLKDIVTPCFTREEYTGCFRKNVYEWKCVKCKNIFENHIDYGTEPRCQICFPSNISAGESELKEWINSLNIEFTSNDRSILDGLELDILILSKKIAIEFNGTYWHSDKFKDKKYHVSKYLKCKEQGIHLIQIFDDEWYSKKDIVKSRLLSALGISKKVYARKCKVRHVTPCEYKTFVDKYHLQGYVSASVLYGLTLNDQVVAVMSFSKARYHNTGYELIRYCSDGNIVGGASRLFSAFVNKYNPKEVISYANRCWSNGNLYKQLGFSDITSCQDNTGFWYVKDFKRYHRTTFNKKRLIKLGYDAKLTGDVIMEHAGYMRIYDCGNYKFQWKV
jgi:hypothetical protein